MSGRDLSLRLAVSIPLLIVASNVPAANPRNAYKRWAIECLFGDAETRGFNLQKTGAVDQR